MSVITYRPMTDDCIFIVPITVLSAYWQDEPGRDVGMFPACLRYKTLVTHAPCHTECTYMKYMKERKKR